MENVGLILFAYNSLIAKMGKEEHNNLLNEGKLI